jgi:hypothetical protein
MLAYTTNEIAGHLGPTRLGGVLLAGFWMNDFTEDFGCRSRRADP